MPSASALVSAYIRHINPNPTLSLLGQVQVNRPIPETTISNLANSHEDTLLLLDLMRHKRQQEGQKKRVNLLAQLHFDEKYSTLRQQTLRKIKICLGEYDQGDGLAAEAEEGGREVRLFIILN